MTKNSLVPVDQIDDRYRAGRAMGDLGPLMKSIATDGVLYPVTVTPSWALITGARRLEAQRRLGDPAVPAVIVITVAEAIEHLRLEQDHGLHAEPLTLQEALELDAVIRSQLQWWPRSEDGGGASERRTGMIAGLLGLNNQQYRKAREIWAAAHGYRMHIGIRHEVSSATQQAAATALAQMNHKEQIQAAHRGFKAVTEPRPVTKARLTRRTQAGAITAGLASLTGLCAGLRTAEPPTGTEPGTLTAWDDDLTKSLRILRELRTKIRNEIR